MDNLHENFAAIAVIGELYNSGKDIYDVLAAYIQIIIQTERLNNFTSVEITDRINKTNSFRVNESIVKTALKRLGLNRKNGIYSLGSDFRISFNENELSEHTRQNKSIVKNLLIFIAHETGAEITENEQKVIVSQFYEYLKEPEHEDTYTMLISKFLMKNSLETTFHEAIARIKEGLLVYEGICFSPEVGQSGKWEYHLDIFLELEVLFYIAGYNGEAHKELYRQLIDYVKEINSLENSKKDKTIRLYYTEDVKFEIEHYFQRAEQIFEKHEIVDPSKKAMVFILDGVISKSDIQIKKVQFYSLIASAGISEYDIDFFSEQNQKFSSIDDNTYKYNREHIVTEKGEQYVDRCTEKIDQINILRRARNNTLREAGCILLTANSTILRCAYMPDAYHDGDTPKAVDLDYLINRFWFKLNKGFGKGDAPKSIDIISKSQIVLASMTVSKVSQTYENLKKRYADGLITDVEVAGIIRELRKVSKNPEDITAEQVDEQIVFLTDYDLSKKIEDIRREEIARQNDKQTIDDLQMRLQESDLRLQESEQQRKLEEQKHEEKEAGLEERILSLELIAQASINRDKRGKKIRLILKKMFRIFLFVLAVLAIGFMIFLMCRLIFKVDPSVSGIVSIVITVISSIVIPLFTPAKKIWKRCITECKLKERT